MKKNNLPRGLRNNNPGNIRINDDLFQGEIRPSKDKSFKQLKYCLTTSKITSSTLSVR